MKRREMKMYGKSACKAAFATRPEDVIRVFVDKPSSVELGEMLKACAKMRTAYRVVDSAELEKVSGARHHEGICFVIKSPVMPSLDELLAKEGPGLLVALDGVGNPHNTGALLRSCAHFGATAMLIGGNSKGLSGASMRTAEGGAEHCHAIPTPDLDEAIRKARDAGYAICATSSHEGEDIYSATLPSRALLLVGEERHGLSPERMAASDTRLRIPGTGHIESLNVSTATGILLAEFWRQCVGPQR